MKLPLWYRKWLGTWYGCYCPSCGEKTFFNWDKFNSDYNTYEQCVNKDCIRGLKKNGIL